MRQVWRWRSLAILSAAVFTMLALHAAWLETPTVDEFVHLPSGCLALKYGDFSLSPKTPPLMRYLMALPLMIQNGLSLPPRVETEPNRSPWAPWEYGADFMHQNASRYFQLFFEARIPSVIACLLTAFFLFRWARTLFGERAAAMAISLFCLDPSILAHGHLATVDAGCMLTLLLSVIALRWALHRNTAIALIVAGFVWGAALMTKFTSVILLPVLVGLIFIHYRRELLRAAALTLVVIATAILTVNLGMAFQGSFKPLGNYQFASTFAQGIQHALPERLAVPFPKQFVMGFDLQKKEAEQGEFESYLLGTWSSEGFKSYNFVTLAVKLPIVVLAMLVIAPWFLLRSQIPKVELALMLLPPALLFVVATFFNKLNIGVRYLLPTYPFIYLYVAALWSDHSRRAATRNRRWLPAAAIGVLGLSLFVALRSHPDHLAYFNELIGRPARGQNVLLDSNIDWGQDLYRLKPALADLHCTGKIKLLYFGHVDPAMYDIEYEIVPSFPVQGVIAVSVNYLMGYQYPVTDHFGGLIMIERNHLAWLRQQEPAMRLGSILVFDLRGPVS